MLDKASIAHIIAKQYRNALTGTSKRKPVSDRENKPEIESLFQRQPLKTTRERGTEKWTVVSNQ